MTVGGALAAGVKAPVARWRLVLTLWLARLVPAFVAVGLPVYDVARETLGRHPDGAALIDPGADATGFAHAWGHDVARGDFAGLPETVLWLVVLTWLLTTVLAGGITARLLYGRGGSGLFAAECGRYAGRFLRLGLLALVFAYALDALVNGVLAALHAEGAKAAFVQDYAIEKSWVRAALYLTLLQVFGMIHAYARIELVVNERRSVVLCWLRGVGHLLTRLPRLLVVEIGMLLAVGAAALLAWLLMRGLFPLEAGASWGSIAVFIALAALGSYLRTGIEIGTMEARCRILAPDAASQDETVDPQPDEPAEFVPV